MVGDVCLGGATTQTRIPATRGLSDYESTLILQIAQRFEMIGDDFFFFSSVLEFGG